MAASVYELVRPLLFALDAENAHGLTLRGLDFAQRTGLARWIARPAATHPVRSFGIDFPNPVGLAAGLDKNGAHLDALASLGFGFIEIGTVTPRPQPGNPRPRLFRLPQQQAIINRMGFNNDGVEALVRNVERARYSGILGINIGKNFDTPNHQAIDDYLVCLRRVHALASYVTVNISSPNTRGLRDLQHAESLRGFVAALGEEQDRLASRHGARTPLLLKIAPDLDDAQMDAMAEVLQGSGLDGLICTNTTLSRDGVESSALASEAGGLSGRPLLERSNRVLKGMRQRLGTALPIIGVGGILEGCDAAEKLQAGAQLVQLYSGLIYRGPALVAECVNEIHRQSEQTA